jgi:hypothetical protein
LQSTRSPPSASTEADEAGGVGDAGASKADGGGGGGASQSEEDTSVEHILEPVKAPKKRTQEEKDPGERAVRDAVVQRTVLGTEHEQVTRRKFKPKGNLWSNK